MTKKQKNLFKDNPYKGNAELRNTHSLQRLANALCYSFDGVCAACAEAGFRELLLLHSTLLIALFFLPFKLAITMVLVFASFFSIIVELLNTAIESAVDHTSLEKHPLAKRAKDAGNAAQYISLILLAILWVMAITHTWF
ncbi:diacylglycerol kinase [Suttonella sp. R2A3]|uniref:diacylglycerol kinase n=1 Tax=Suttonella sp. R2A3 TaxID=2908648 RepID=UPI001F2FAB10|nr:diacylglycerol kinase [Suttonella sp. R2A3]UJF23831.1 diacylglycerol kinase [Suttonella sp. R2A3]